MRAASVALACETMVREARDEPPRLAVVALARSAALCAGGAATRDSGVARLSAYVLATSVALYGALSTPSRRVWAVRIRPAAPGYVPAPPLNGRQIAYVPSATTLLIILVCNIASWTFDIRSGYVAFLTENPIYRRIGFNNMCVFLDLHPITPLAAAMLYQNVLHMIVHMAERIAHGALGAALMIGATPMYLLIFYVSPRVDLFAHAALGYGTAVVHGVYARAAALAPGAPRLTCGARLLTVAGILVGVAYTAMVVVAFGTEWPLPDAVRTAGWVADRTIMLYLAWTLVQELLGTGTTAYYLQFAPLHDDAGARSTRPYPQRALTQGAI